MRSDGTVIGRRFLKLPREYDSLSRKISRIKYAQRHGSRKVSRVWKFADVIIFEALKLSGRKRGSKKQRLHRFLLRGSGEQLRH